MTQNFRLPFFILLLCTVLPACSAAPSVNAPESISAPTLDTAVRSEPVVAGRRARVFVMAGLGDNCEPLAAPSISVDQKPAKGDISFVPGQETKIETAGSSACIGRKATGTGIYYTARAGETGTDRFSITAKLASGEVTTRSFEVRIEQ